MKRRTVLLAGAWPLLGAPLATPDAAQAQPRAPRPPDVSLLDDQGHGHSLRMLLARHTVAINFIYTGCASFCPPQTAVFREVQRRLADARAGTFPPLLLSISIDPLNDTPRALARYAARFDVRLGVAAHWLMLTGDVAALRETARAFDADTDRVDQHPAQLWVGCVPRSRWLNAAGLTSPDDVLRLMRVAEA